MMTQAYRPPLRILSTKSNIGPLVDMDVPRTGIRLVAGSSGSYLHDITLCGRGDCEPPNLPVMIEGREGVTDVTIGRVHLSNAMMTMAADRYWNGDLISLELGCTGWKISGTFDGATDACIDAKEWVKLIGVSLSKAPRPARLWKGGEATGVTRISWPTLWGGTSAPCGVFMKTGIFEVETLVCTGFGDAPLLWGEPDPDQAPPEIIILDKANSILPSVLVHGKGKVSFA